MTREQAAALLGLGDVASRSDILHAFSRKARLTHPDLLPDPTPEAVRAANDRFVLLTTARDLLLSAPGPGQSAADAGAPSGAAADGAGPAGTPPDADASIDVEDDYPRVTHVYEGAGRRKRHGMGSSIATVIALAIVLVSVVTWQDSWRTHLLGVPTRDLTAGAVVTAVVDPITDRSEDCPGTGSCVLLDLTSPEDCTKASARFEVTPAGSGESTTETRELTGLRAGRPVEVALPGRRAELLFLGCGG